MSLCRQRTNPTALTRLAPDKRRQCSSDRARPTRPCEPYCASNHRAQLTVLSQHRALDLQLAQEWFPELGGVILGQRSICDASRSEDSTCVNSVVLEQHVRVAEGLVRYGPPRSKGECKEGE